MYAFFWVFDSDVFNFMLTTFFLFVFFFFPIVSDHLKSWQNILRRLKFSLQNCYFKGSNYVQGLDNYLCSWEEICCHPVLAAINSGPVLFHLYPHLHHPALFWIIFETNNGQLTNMSLFLAVLGLVAIWGLFSVCQERRLFSSCRASFPCTGTGSRAGGLQWLLHWARSLWPAGARAQVQGVWCLGIVAPQHVGSSGSGMELVSPVLLQGGILTTGPPGKPNNCQF